MVKMAASLLENNLRSLHKCLTSGDSSSLEQSEGIISNITQLCLHEIDDKEIDLCCSALFDKDKGIVTFLNKAFNKDEFLGCKQKLLDLLSAFIQRTEKKVLPYTVDIKDVCITLFFRDRFAKVKNGAVSVLAKLLELTAGTNIGKDLNIPRIIEKFFMELSKGKVTSTVKESIFVLLGVVAEVYPEHMTSYSERFIGLCVSSLKAEMTAKTRKAELSIIAGSLSGLTSCLVNFTQSADERSQQSYEIFKYARMAIDPKVDYTRYHVPSAGLKLFTKHAAQFSLYLIEDYQGMYDKLRYWSRHHNRDMLHLGLSAIEAFLGQISEMLVTRAEEGHKEGAVFKFFIQEFRTLMNNTSASAKEVSLAIRGYGLLAAPCKTFLKQADVQFMFSEMMSKSEQQFLSQDENLEERLFNLPSYLEALGNIIKQLDEISETYAISLERLLVLLIEKIASLPQTHFFMCLKSILWLLLAVMPKGTTFQQILSGVVFQGLIRTCSHPPVIELEQMDQTETESSPEAVLARKITYKDYITLWTGLLNSARIKDFSVADISLDVRHRLTDVMYDELIAAVLKILSKLDLTSTSTSELSSQPESEDVAGTSGEKSEEGGTTGDPTQGVQPNRPKDHQVFINLVDFCRDLLPAVHYELFEKWIFTFCHKVILCSTDNPLVSGFYKLLALSMKISNKLNFFKDAATVCPSDKPTDSMEVDQQLTARTQQWDSAYLLMKKFSKEVLVRMKQYKDDLLASCLTFILALPKEIIAQQMVEVVPVIQITLKMGLSYLPLAKVALDALEYWSDTLPTSVIQPHYCKILPHLDTYLKTADKGAEEVSVDSTVNVTKSKTGRGRKKFVRMIKGPKKDEIKKSYESELSQVKLRVMRYLGGLGGSQNYALLADSEAEVSKQAIAWDKNRHLKFDMPFIDMKPTIFLDPFLPHVVALATKSSDRQTKVAACELLHSLVLFSLGRGATQPGETAKRNSMAPLYKNLFPVLLQLACDVELVAKQLFEPLTMQIIHWFTGSKKAESEETMSLLDAIFDGIIQPTDTSLRDFCATCLREFMKWSIKHTSRKTETSPTNAKSVLKRLFTYALHPSAFKRLGAALAFNNIYTVFREDNTLVDIFTFQILVHFVESLAIAHKDEKSLGTQEQACKALEHLEKIICKKADILRKESKLRTEPSQWSKITIDICVRWFMRQCGRPQTECRHMCMKLLHKMTPLIQGIKSTQMYFQAFLKSEKQKYFITRFEGGGHTSHTKVGLVACPTLRSMGDTVSLPSTLAWFDTLLAALDCYTTVFGENLLTPVDIFGGAGMNQTNVYKAVSYFIDNIALSDIKVVGNPSETTFFTPREVDEFNREKCTVIVRLMNFLSVVVATSGPKDLNKAVPPSVWSDVLWKMVCMCVVEPGTVGFNLGEVEVMKNLPREMEQVLMVMTRKLPNNLCENMKKQFNKTLSGKRNLSKHLPLTLNDLKLDPIYLQQLLGGYRQLHTAGLLTTVLSGVRNTGDLAQKLFDNVFQGVVCKTSGGGLEALTLTPVVHTLVKEMLALSFHLGLPGKVLVEAVLDSTMVSGSSKGLEQCHGDLVFSMFKSVIASHMASESDVCVKALAARAGADGRKVSRILVAMVDHVTRDKALRKRLGQNIVKSVLLQWKTIATWCDSSSSVDLQSMTLLLLTKLLLIDSKFVSTPSSPSFEDVFGTYLQCLIDTRTNLAFKCRVLDLLPFFVNVPKPHITKLKTNLDRLVADNFPLKSTEFPKGSSHYRDYLTALDKILSGLELSGSLVLLELLISIACREQKHTYEDTIQQSLNRFTRRLPGDKQKLAVDVAFDVFCKENFPAEIRTATLEKVALPMLRLCHKSALLEFYLDHMKDLRNILEAKQVKGAGLENQLVSKTGCFQLLDIMYSHLTKDEVSSKNSTLNEKFCQIKDEPIKTGSEMTRAIMKIGHAAKGEDTRGETTLLNQRRLYHCAAYNMLISVVSCTQTEAKFYQVFLFKEDESKGDFLLDNLIDKDRTYEFPTELTSPMERKKQFVSLRKEVKERRQEQGMTMETEYSSFNLASQYLADSSLHDDVSQYDFSTAGTTQFSPSPGDKGKTRLGRIFSYNDPDDDTETKVVVQDDYVELEMDDLNKHECMATCIALLQHMQRTGVTPPVTAGTVATMPGWMDYLHTKMKSAKTHVNVKLFIAKLVSNCTQIFQPYARYWLRPLSQLILSGALGSDGINYFVVDVVVTMMSWHQVAIPQDTAEERAMATRVVEYLTANVFSDTRPVFRNNLELLKTLLQCWRERLEVPYNVIYKLMMDSRGDPMSPRHSTGIQILGVVLACKLPPYGPAAPVDRDKFFSTVSHYLTHRLRVVYAATAEVVGMIFQYLAEKEKETEGPFYDHVLRLMNSMHLSKPENFVIGVHRIHRHYPPLAAKFVNKILFMLPKMQGEFRSLSLEIIHGCVDSIESIYIELKSKGLMSYLSHRDEQTQLITLKIVKSIMGKLEPKELMALLPLVTAFSSHPSMSCRAVMYDILMWVYDNYRRDDNEDAHIIIKQTKEGLLRGLGDEDLHSRLMIQNFWSSETRLPPDTLDRLVAMLEAMYVPVTEQQYLSYATNLLLEMTSKSPDYQRQIFEHPLSECKFQDYNVKSSWRQRHIAMTPLFANTMATQAMDTDSPPSDSLDGQIQATADVQQFTATQDGSRAPFNWLTQSSLDTFTDYGTVGSEPPSALLFSVGSVETSARIGRPRVRPKPSGFGQPRQGPSKVKTEEKAGPSDSDEGSEMLRLKRRFLRDEEANRIFFARRTVRTQKMREVALQEQKKRREHQVTMYRKYRIGDLPDIQIKYSYIIAPLQAVAHRDSTIAKILFSELFKAIYDEMDQVKVEREIEPIVTQIKNSLGTVLSQSIQYHPPFIGCMLDIVYQLRSQLSVDVTSVGSSATFSNLQPLGIVVLEEQLIIHEPEESRPSKRGKMDSLTISKEVPTWIELARLYKSVDEYDVLLGIFSGKIGTQEITQKAVACEARGDYYQAKKFYDEALGYLELPDVNPEMAEVDLWDDCRMECLDNLTNWTELDEVSTSGIEAGDLTSVWDDTFYQEHYLPFIMRSKVKLVLLGDQHQQSLISFVDEAMKIPEHKSLLENRYCGDLALLAVWQEDYDRARHYTSMAIQRFQQEWSSTDTLMMSSRVNKLQQLQPLVELQEFLDFISHESNFGSPGPANRLLERWERRSPDMILDSVRVWDDIVTNRNLYLDHIATRLTSREQNSEDSMEVDTTDTFLEAKLRLHLQMAESCKDQNNFKLALQILGENKSQCKSSGNAGLWISWGLLYTSTHHKKAHSSQTSWADDTFTSIASTVDLLGKNSKNATLEEIPAFGRRHFVLLGQTHELLVDGVRSVSGLGCLGDRNRQRLMDITGVSKVDETELIESLVKRGFENIKQSLHYEDSGDALQNGYSRDAAFMAVAKFCDRILRMMEDDELELSKATTKTFPDTVVVCLLNAMRLDSMEAKQRFPRLLQLVEIYPDCMGTFIDKCREVPCWMYLLWISQMMALMDKPQAPAVQPTLQKIAAMYPQAVVYHFKLSQEGFQFGDKSQDKKNKAIVDKLADQLNEENVPLVTKLISALEQFGQPDQIFKDWGNDMLRILRKKKQDSLKIKEMYQEMYRQVLEPSQATLPSHRDDVSSTQTSSQSIIEMGQYLKKFSARFKKEIDKCFGDGGRKLVGMKMKEFFGIFRRLCEDMEQEVRGGPKTSKLIPPGSLKEYCKWMVDFNPNTEGNNLEIPGQYTGLTKPLPEYHVKIAGFDQRVLVMSSIRKPKRVVIRGNDEKEYPYLVKGGEDLRQDQRIEQLFFLMNQVFDRDPACRQRKLNLKTYQVIPMTPRVGLIEWVSNTTPMKDFLNSSLTEQEYNFVHHKTNGPGAQHNAWLQKVGKDMPMAKMYGLMYQKYNKTEATRELRLKESKIPWDLFRRAFHDISTSPEAFHVLRCTLAVSHALVSICQYILGIGDRHLSNFMINLKTGQMIGIDFGHAFGSATQFLPIPELMPFRLTRQLRNLMLPLQVKGLMESTMVHALRALREDYDLLLATMDIFVKEPSVDWLVNAEKQMQSLNLEDSLEEENNWYPKEKVRYVKRKLKGENPRFITRDELRLGHSKNDALRSLETVVMGERGDLRAQLSQHGLSVEEQVASLIDQATDSNILGRVYAGWEPWM
ncbi:DNA-dependent protein kinase catalytic subunit-like [Argopecten irradians]|uniref:DNA-dependent protein kinase catalytic subunit-like n=1 Tax=Argopecten irradians TaxID=31199 RepID=UPI003723FC38